MCKLTYKSFSSGERAEVCAPPCAQVHEDDGPDGRTARVAAPVFYVLVPVQLVHEDAEQNAARRGSMVVREVERGAREVRERAPEQHVGGREQHAASHAGRQRVQQERHEPLARRARGPEAPRRVLHHVRRVRDGHCGTQHTFRFLNTVLNTCRRAALKRYNTYVNG